MDRVIIALVALVVGAAAGWFGAGQMSATDKAPVEAAQAPADEQGEIYATVNGSAVTKKDIEMFARAVGADFNTAPPQIVAALVEYSIAAQLLSEEAARAGYGERPEVARALDAARRDTLYNAYVADLSQQVAGDDAIAAAIAEGKFGITVPVETKARHILVAEEDEAKALIEQLDEGADFAELAKEHSTGPSGPGGGDLGWFTQDQMVEPFSVAAFAMEPGSHSAQPVKTQFGWHVIKVEDRRENAEAVRSEMANALMEDAIEAKITKLRDEADVVILHEPTRELIEARDNPPAVEPDAEAPAEDAPAEDAPAEDTQAEETQPDAVPAE